MDNRRVKKRNQRPYLYAPRTSSYQIVEPLKESSQYSHSLFKAKKMPGLLLDDLPQALIPQRYKNIWYLKENDTAKESIEEVIALEGFRLCIPGQPKARLVKADDDQLLVNTKEVIGFQTLEYEAALDIARFKQKNANGGYFGLGKVLVISLLFNETDLKENNLGVNDKGQVIKIDCGCCYAKLDKQFQDRQYPITTNDLRTLPFINDYEAHNWLDMRGYYSDTKKQTISKTSKLFNPNFAMWPSFRAEVNAALLCVAVLPALLLAEVIERCVPEDILKNPDYMMIVEACQEEVLARRKEMIRASLADICFRNYLKSPEAETELKEYITYLKSYYTTGKLGLEMETYEKVMLERFEKLRNQLASVLESPLLENNDETTLDDSSTEEDAPNHPRRSY